MSEFKIKLANLLKARFPYLYIPTWEENRVVVAVEALAKDEAFIKTPRAVFSWSVTEGFVGSEHASTFSAKTPVKALDFIEKYDKPAIFILKDFHVYFGVQGRSVDYELIRKLRDVNYHLRNSANPKNVILISPSLVIPDDLLKDITIVEFPLPTFNDIKGLLNEMIEINKVKGRIKFDLAEDHKDSLAIAALGLTLKEAENAFARSMVEDGKFDINDIDIVLEEKHQVIRKTGILDYIKTDVSIKDVGGLQNLKKWLKKRDKSWQTSAKKYNLLPPKGVLITGIPGCGKSLTAKAVSDMWHLPLLRLDIGKVFSGLVGSSEENMRKAIEMAEAIAPSILWIDEIEKGFSGTGSFGDSGTSTRVFGTFLTWMQEKCKPVFVIATANNINLLPTEFLRKGRFDEIFFVNLPSHAERRDIFKVHLIKRLKDPDVIGDFKIDDENLNVLANATEGFIGAEIEQIVIAGLFEAFSEDRSIEIKDMTRAINNTIPLSVTQKERIESMCEWADTQAVAANESIDQDGSVNNEAPTAGRALDF